MERQANIESEEFKEAALKEAAAFWMDMRKSVILNGGYVRKASVVDSNMHPITYSNNGTMCAYCAFDTHIMFSNGTEPCAACPGWPAEDYPRNPGQRDAPCVKPGSAYANYFTARGGTYDEALAGVTEMVTFTKNAYERYMKAKNGSSV